MTRPGPSTTGVQGVTAREAGTGTSKASGAKIRLPMRQEVPDGVSSDVEVWGVW